MKSRSSLVRRAAETNVSLVRQTRTSITVGESYSCSSFVRSSREEDESALSLEESLSTGTRSGLEAKRLRLDVTDESCDILDHAAAKHKLSIRPKKRHADSRQKTITSQLDIKRTFRSSENENRQDLSSDEVSNKRSLLERDEDGLFDIRCKREAVIKELLETEEEFGRDLNYVVEKYLKPASDNYSVPRIVSDNIDTIFSNFQQITNFHNTTLIEGIRYYSDEPRMLGRTFLRLERDFDKHTAYCRDEPLAQDFLTENQEAADFFEELSQKLGDEKSICEYLKLPVQRINDYQVLLKDLVKYSEKLGENADDLKRALELMLAIPQRANDNKFLNNIEGFHSNIHKLGRLIRHDWFYVSSGDTESKERYLFLFKDHILICKVKKISEDRSVFSLKQIVLLPENKIRDISDEKSFEIIGPDDVTLKITARKSNTKESWLNEIRKYNSDTLNIEEKSEGVVITEEVEEKNSPLDSNTTSAKVASESEPENIQKRQEETDTMNRRYSTKKSFKAYEESYSVSGHSRREVYSHSSATASSRYSASSIYDSESGISQSYERSSKTITDGGFKTASVLALSNSEKPIFTRTLTGQSLEPGDTAVFECQLESDVKLTWLKDNKALDDRLADRIVRSSSDDGTHRLELQHVTELDSGTYTAMAQSDDSVATCTAQLLVQKVSEEERKRRLEENMPIFIVRLKDTELLANTNFRFMVKVKGTPNPQVEFFKNGVPLKNRDDHIKIVDDKADIGFYELVISDVQPDHAGLYSCKASNNYGTAHCEGTITVTDHKRIFEGHDNDELLTPGDKPSFTWIKDGKPFDPDERFKVLLGNEDDSLALIFQHVKPEDAGLYTCVASTTTGRISCSAELSVQGAVNPLAKEPEKPKIVKESKQSEAEIGGSAMLEAKILGFPKPDIKWYHEGEEIKASGRFKFLYEDQESMTLVIKNVNPRDGGSYKIIAKNELGEDCTELSLTVKGAPKIVKKLTDVSAKFEETIKLSTIIEGCPTPEVKWLKDGNEIVETERIKITKESDEKYSLTIAKASKSDAGSYSVVATNEINQCTDFCKVQVQAPPQILKSIQKNTQVSEGEQITLEIQVAPEAALEIKWMKDGEEIKSDGTKVKITYSDKGSTLTIFNSVPNDSATYSVQVSNGAGTTTDEGKVIVSSKQSAPVIKKELKDTFAKEGESELELSVEIAAFPEPKIRWYVDEMEIEESHNEYKKMEENNKYKLVLKKVTEKLKGTYTCKVENEFGCAETSAKLTVHSKPRFEKTLEPKIVVEEGAELKLEIECHGCPEPEIIWFKDGEEIQTDAHIKITRDIHRSESYSMSLTLIKRSDSGFYEAKATNSMGSATTKTYVEVFSKVTETLQKEVVTVKEEKLDGGLEEAIAEEKVGFIYKEPMDEHNELTSKTGTREKLTVEEPTKISLDDGDLGTFVLEEVDNSYSEEKANSPYATCGIVEECLDSENISECRTNKLHVNRGVSIVSLSDDERTLSRNNSLLETEGFDKLPEETCKLDSHENLKLNKGSDAAVPTATDIEDVSEKNKKILEKSETVETSPAELEPATLEVSRTEPHDNNNCVTSPSVRHELLNNHETREAATLHQVPAHSIETDASEPCNSLTFHDGHVGLEGKEIGEVKNVESRVETGDSDAEEDPVVNALLSRIKKQRSVLEEILTKEAETKREDDTQVKPYVKEQLEDQTCSTKDTVNFKCVFAANSETEVTWSLDGNEIKVDGTKFITENKIMEKEGNCSDITCTLKIKEPELADAGTYTVKAKNKYGYGESSASLTIRVEKPEIKNLKDATAYVGEEVVLEAEIISVIDVVVHWVDKNGKKIKNDERFTLVEDKKNKRYQLKIKETTLEDSGEYTVVVSKDNSELEKKSAQILVQDSSELKPNVKVPLKDQNSSENQTVSFECVMTGNPEPEIAWFHNGKQVDANNEKVTFEKKVKKVEEKACEYSYVLKIKELAKADAGLYMIKGKNKYGYGESEASLTIQIPEDTRPIIKNLKDVQVIPGQTAEFKAEVLSETDVTVTWLDKNNEKITNNDRFNLIEDKENKMYTLKIIKTTNEDVGNFTLVATNASGEKCSSAKLFLNGEKPSFVKPIEDTEVKDGVEIDFHVRCNGVPKPEVQWFKNGKELVTNKRVTVKTSSEGQVSSSIAFEKFSSEDVAQYKVVATNLVGTAENKFQLKMVQAAPSFEKGLPRSEEVDEGEVLELKCKLNGSPLPAVQWLKDGVPLSPSERVQIVSQPDGQLKLRIDDVKPSDSGTYSVVAKNPNGNITGNCVAAVNPKSTRPKMIEGLKDCKAEIGKPLKLEAKVTAFPPPEVKWFKDGKVLRPSQGVQSCIEDDGKIKLEIKAVKPEDAGVYSVKISNKLGEVGEEAKVEVLPGPEKPKFEAELKPTSVVEGFPAKFNVKCSGNPKPLVKWYRNGSEIVPDGENIIIKNEPDGSTSLLLNKTTPEDAGQYMAKAINDEGEISSVAPLDVLSKKMDQKNDMEPSFVVPLNNVTIDEDNSLVLSASIAGNPIPDVTWEKDGKPFKSDDRVLLTCDGKKVNLEIKSAKPTDSGVYTCFLKNPLGEAKSKATANVKKIYSEPVFVEKLKDLEQVEGEDVKFVARITGNPKPEVEWFFNGLPLPKDNKYEVKSEGDKYYLLIRNAGPENRGLYRCCASNRAGKADCVAQLNLLPKRGTQQNIEPPSFLKKISDCDIYKGMTAKFTACCSGFPKPEFEWFRGEEKLQPSKKIKMECEDNGLLRLSVLDVGDDDIGPYTLRIFNCHGEAKCSANLICDVLEPRSKKATVDKVQRSPKGLSDLPLPLSDKPIISRMTDRHLTLSWKPYIPLGPQAPATYIIEMCPASSDDWFTVRKGIRSCACDIRNLEPFKDYRFRVRVENKYGISEPSPYAETHRQKIIPELPKFVPYLSPGIDFRPETSPYFPKDFDIESPPHDRYQQAPKFLRQEHEVQYGIKNQNSNLFWFVYGYPKPTISYYFNDEPIEMGGRYDCSYTRNGQATLFINKMLDRDVGVYEAVARNEHGEARQRVRLEIAEHPVFILRPEESYIMLRGSGTLTARIYGVPYPEIKWYKDWQPLAMTSRIKMHQTAPDTVVLTIKDAILKDEGLYSVSATNVAGSVSSSAMVHIEEQEETYRYATYEGGVHVKAKTEPYNKYYDIGDELGRGTQGITYHATERRSGQNYAAKFMHGRSELKTFMLNEFNVMNSLNHRKLIRLHDSFETQDLLVLVMELAGGGELLEWLIKQTFITEYEICDFIRQILWGLEYLHDNSYAHLSLTLNDLLISRPDGDEIKICDFGLSRKITLGNLMNLNYGMPEFVAPEVVNGEGVGFAADMWSLGIITYILLSGFSPFRGINDRETLTRIKEGTWKFEDIFSNISAEAKDFITKLLVFKPEDRMNVKAALKHPWLQRAGIPSSDQYKIPTDNLRNYYSTMKSWYKNANCKSTYRRQPLSNAFTHPSKMVYPPGHDFTPEPDEEPRKTVRQLNARPTTATASAKEPLNYEVGNFKSESHYQYGPDTYLLQLRDVDLPCRLRHYMKVAANREQNYSTEPPEKHIDWRAPVIRERRKFTDIMDEEIEDERRARISEYGSEDVYSLRRLKHEVSCRSDGHAEAEAMLEYKREGHLPFFREKPKNLAILQNQPAELSCMVVGDPEPTVQWFKNDLVIAETSRIKMRTDINKRFYLKFDPAIQLDVGVYKVVARNKVGQAVARMRVVLATVPLSPEPPQAIQVSDSEVLLKWKPQIDDVFTPILCYSLQCKEKDSENWTALCKNIDHEFWLVENLQPSTNYMFRLCSKNCAGWSAPGLPSSIIKTKDTGAVKINISETLRQLQSEIISRGDEVPEDSKPCIDYSVEDSPLEWLADSNLSSKYDFTSEVFRGKFSLIVKGLDKTNSKQIVAKIFEVNSNTEKDVAQEFETIKSLRHERIAALVSALRPAPNLAVFILEKLQGADILSYFAARQEYNEDMIVTVFTQVLDGLQYLHWRGYCHLDIQPDNIVLACVRSLNVKLVDFGSAKRVSKLGTIVSGPCTEYSAPEIICNEAAFPQTDIWSVGVIIYVLLSGVSPFRGESEEETKQNISFVRYRFEHLFKEISQEATRFLMQIFKRTPSKRPTVEESFEARWFLSSEFMIKKRLKASFPGHRLKAYNESYHSEKSGKGVSLSELTKTFGDKALKRSNSIQEELINF